MCYINNTQQDTHFEFGGEMDRDIVLFDMDGTLTEARQAFSRNLSSPLWDLAKIADVGIVTGSDLNYVKEQMSSIIDVHSIRYRLHLLPCNGTKHLVPPTSSSEDHTSIHEVSMEKELGKSNYTNLMGILLRLQAEMSEFDIPLTGHFISARGSMINWSPMGRNADDKQRSRFKKFDKKYNFRYQFYQRLLGRLKEEEINNVTVKLGGDTSFDIYPTGWDKTYALRHFSGRNVWFVGDRARSPKGNDYEIFQACGSRSFHTSGPEQTIEVIREITKSIKEQ